MIYLTMKLGKYIDRGTFSKVYIDAESEDRVIKVVRRFKWETDLERFLLDNEVEICKSWPFKDVMGMVKIYDVERGDRKKSDVWWFGMEYGGCNLETFLLNGKSDKSDRSDKNDKSDGSDKSSKSEKNGHLSDKVKIEIIVQLIDVVDTLEKIGYRHLDIKSKNILIKDGIVKLCDYDMLVSLGDIRKIKDFGKTVGTMRYLPPQFDDLELRRCIWSLGVVFYELCYGKCLRIDNDGCVISPWNGTIFDKLLIGMLQNDIEKRYDLKDCKYELHNLLVTSKKV